MNELTKELIGKIDNSDGWNSTIIIKEGANVNTKVSDGRSILQYAIENNVYWLTLQIMVCKGANVNERAKDGRSILEYVIEKNISANVLDAMIKKGANVNERAKDGRSILEYAIENNVHWQAVQMMIDKGANVNEKTQDGRSILQYAIDKNVNREVLNEMIDKGANVNKRMKLLYGRKISIIEYAIDKNVHWKTLEMMIKKGANVNEKTQDGRSILQYAIDQNIDWERLSVIVPVFDFEFHANQKAKNIIGFDNMSPDNKTNLVNRYKNDLLRVVNDKITNLSLFCDSLKINNDSLKRNPEFVKFNRFVQNIINEGFSKFNEGFSKLNTKLKNFEKWNNYEFVEMLQRMKNDSESQKAKELEEMKNNSEFPTNQKIVHKDEGEIYDKNYLFEILKFQKNNLIIEEIDEKLILEYFAIKEYKELNKVNPQEYPMNDCIKRKIEYIESSFKKIEKYVQKLNLHESFFEFDSLVASRDTSMDLSQ